MADALTVGMQAIGGLSKTIGAVAAGNEAARSANFEAAQLEREARAAQARASHIAAEEGRQRRLALSRARAVGAASGAGRAARIEGDIEAEGQYRALTAIFEGEEAAAGRMTQAAARRYDGSVARRAGFMKAGASVLNTGSGIAKSEAFKSLLEKYG